MSEFLTFFTQAGIRILVSVVVIIFTFKIINFVSKKIDKKLEKKRVDLTISRVISSSFRFLFKLLVIICLIGYLGVETASISAVVASIGVGISLAVQGTLSNFAGGMIIIIMRPFKIGDFIKSKDESGTVESIHMFYTQLKTPDNKVVLVPNGLLANDVIVNYNAKDIRRCDLVIKVSYKDDVNLIISLLRKVCASYNDILDPFVKIGGYGESSIDIYVRVWVKTEDYWPTYYHLLETLRKVLLENGIEIPYNQLDVNVYSQTQL